MAIDHESPFKERRIKDRRITAGDGSGPEEEEGEVYEHAAVSEEEQEPAARGPPWLRPLLTACFYTTCEAHPHSRRGGERTMFCLDCAAAAGVGALCGLCVDHAHLGHRVIQIRRSSYSSVVRLSDVSGLVDMDGVQTYIINGARVVFLNERTLGHNHQHSSRLKGSSSYACVACRRALHNVFRFCSIGCKVAAGFSCHDGRSTCYSPSFPSLMRSAVAQSCTPPTPPPTMPLHRRKSTPHRAPFGNLVC